MIFLFRRKYSKLMHLNKLKSRFLRRKNANTPIGIENKNKNLQRKSFQDRKGRPNMN